ncbi:MAG: hypothetical protein ABI867_22835 [Kofleriaceae bacterium]
MLALQPLAHDGTPRGTAGTVAMPEGLEPKLVYPVGASFVVLVRKWDWQHNDVDWLGVVVDRAGRITVPPQSIGLADLDITDGRIVDDHRIALHAGPAAISKNPTQPVRWQIVTLAGARLSSTVGSAPAVIEHARDALEFAIANRATGGGAGPGGMIIEPMGRPALERTLHGKPVGDVLDLEWRGNSVAHGMYVDGYVAWTGTYVLYPFRDDSERLLPIDCRP